jgi:streptogramin lyase
LVYKKSIVAVIVIIIALAAFWFVFLKPMSEPNESSVNTSQTRDPYVQEYSLPPHAAPNGLIVDRQGIVWVTSSASNILYSFDPISSQIKSYEIRSDNLSTDGSDQNSTMVWTILQDKDGFIWFSPLGTKSIWEFDPSNGKFEKFQSENGSAFQMKADGNNGNIWFTTLSGNTLGVIQNDSGTSGYKIMKFYLGNNTAPAGLFLKNDYVWVTEITTQKIMQYQINRQAGLVQGITKVAELPTTNNVLSSPTDLLVDNRTIWLTEHATSFLTEYNQSSNDITRYPTSQNIFHATTLPFWIRGVNDGRDLWFNEHEGNKLAYFDTVNKTMIEYNILSRPKDGYLTYPLNIATDPRDDKVLWFSEWNTDKIGKIDGHVQIPFSINAATGKVILNNDASKETIVNLDLTGSSPYNTNRVFINASSSVSPAAGFGNIDMRISPSVLNLSSDHTSQLFLRNYAAHPGNYSIGISVSDGFVAKTIFLDLVVP